MDQTDQERVAEPLSQKAEAVLGQIATLLAGASFDAIQILNQFDDENPANPDSPEEAEPEAEKPLKAPDQTQKEIEFHFVQSLDSKTARELVGVFKEVALLIGKIRTKDFLYLPPESEAPKTVDQRFKGMFLLFSHLLKQYAEKWAKHLEWEFERWLLRWSNSAIPKPKEWFAAEAAESVDMKDREKIAQMAYKSCLEPIQDAMRVRLEKARNGGFWVRKDWLAYLETILRARVEEAIQVWSVLFPGGSKDYGLKLEEMKGHAVKEAMALIREALESANPLPEGLEKKSTPSRVDKIVMIRDRFKDLLKGVKAAVEPYLDEKEI